LFLSKKTVVLTLATAVLLGFTACGLITTPPVKADSVTAKNDRKLAPDFALKDVDGRTVHLSDYRGKVVVLDFWATWCGPCRIEIPWFTEFERRDKDRGFAVLGVSMDDDGWTAVKPFLKELNVNYRVMIGDDKTADQYGGVDALPTTFLIDRDGRIASAHIGLTGRREFEDAIEQLLQDNHTESRGVASPTSARADGADVGARAQAHHL
jgi:cytochrome c biogenesis protein CcmG/thiol:disulfide interchange protein DsbE